MQRKREICGIRLSQGCFGKFRGRLVPQSGFRPRRGHPPSEGGTEGGGRVVWRPGQGREAGHRAAGGEVVDGGGREVGARPGGGA